VSGVDKILQRRREESESGMTKQGNEEYGGG